MELLAQVFGFTAIADSFFIYQQTKRRNILILKILQDLCWMIHYALLSCWSAAATSMICTFRGVVFYNNDKKWGKSIFWLFGFVSLYIVSSIFTWTDFFCLFPALGSSLSAVAFWMKNPRHTKILSLFASACSLTYNITHSQSPAVYIGVCITVTSCIISLIRSIPQKDQPSPQ